MLEEHREALQNLLEAALSVEDKVLGIEQVFTDYIEWLDTHISPRTHPWIEYTSTEFRYGDVYVHVKQVQLWGHPVKLVSIRHVNDLPLKDWNLFWEIKNRFIGEDKYGVEVYPPLDELRDTSFTYHILEMPLPLGFSHFDDQIPPSES